jgi:hypothetical protein
LRKKKEKEDEKSICRSRFFQNQFLILRKNKKEKEEDQFVGVTLTPAQAEPPLFRFFSFPSRKIIKKLPLVGFLYRHYCSPRKKERRDMPFHIFLRHKPHAGSAARLPRIPRPHQ